MDTGSMLTIKAYHVTSLEYGDENTVRQDGTMTVDSSYSRVLCDAEPLIDDISIRVIKPDEHDQHTNTIMDIIPISTKVFGILGEGITHTLTGVYVMLTGVDTDGRQVCNFGASDGILADKVVWGKAGTPLESELLISFDVVLKAGTWTEREGPEAAHRACDRFCQIFRNQLKKFDGRKCTEKHVFQETYEPDRKNVVIVKEVSGQGAVYETHLMPNEPGGYEGSVSVIDMGWMPAVLTPNQYRDGVIKAMD